MPSHRSPQRRRGVLAGALALLLVAGLGLAACGGSDDDDASATTEVTTAPSTTAPATTAPATTAPAETETETGATRPGTAAAGETVFLAKCDGCHAGAGTRAGYGPKLQGAGLTEAQIRETVINGRLPLMPAGRATGQDLEDVVAYVVSLQ